MRILIVTRNLVGFGGIPYSLVNLAKGKAQSNDTKNILEYLILENKKIDVNLKREIEKAGVNIISKKLIFKNLLYIFFHWNKYDFILTTCFRTFYISKIITFKSKKVILWLRGANIIVNPFKRILFNILNNNIVIANSRYTGLVNGLLENQFTVLYNGVDNSFLKEDTSDFWERFNIPKSAYIICYIGGWSEVKNHKVLIEAFNLLAKKYKEVYLLLIGEFSALTAKAKKLIDQNVLSRVRLIDKTSGVAKYLKNIDLYVHPCYAEGFGNVVIEALLAKKPVIGARGGALIEILSENFLFNPFDSNELLAKIKRCFYIRNEINQVKLDEYSLKKFYAKFTEIFEK